jgi:hypothetical protein
MQYAISAKRKPADQGGRRECPGHAGIEEPIHGSGRLRCLGLSREDVGLCFQLAVRDPFELELAHRRGVLAPLGDGGLRHPESVSDALLGLVKGDGFSGSHGGIIGAPIWNS